MGKLVLVIDDEDPVREAIHDILETIEVTVIGASNGVQGIQLFRQHQADIAAVMIDMRLPGMDGSEIVERIRAIDPEAKIILSSAYRRHEIKEMLGDLTPIEFLSKPFDLSTLIEVIQPYLDGPTG